MLKKINLLSKYPKTKGRKKIAEERINLTEEENEISRKFGYEYFDGPRKFGLGGYYYDPKFLSNVVKDFISYYGLSNSSKILDVVEKVLCFMILSKYCQIVRLRVLIFHNIVSKIVLIVCEIIVLWVVVIISFEDNSFDLVISIATIHNLDLEGVKKSIREINRVTKKDAL